MKRFFLTVAAVVALFLAMVGVLALTEWIDDDALDEQVANESID